MVTLGGDGTILYGAKQFTGPYIPFVVSFAMVSNFLNQFDLQGSLGYLCNFEFEEYQKTLKSLLFEIEGEEKKDKISLDIRSRLKINIAEGNPLRKVYKGG